MVPSCPKKNKFAPSPPLVQCCFGLAAQACISCVTANNIAIGEGGNSLLSCDSKHFCQGECKKVGILVMCLNRSCPRLQPPQHRVRIDSRNRDPCWIFLQVISQAGMPDDILARAKFYLPIHIPCNALYNTIQLQGVEDERSLISAQLN